MPRAGGNVSAARAQRWWEFFAPRAGFLDGRGTVASRP